MIRTDKRMRLCTALLVCMLVFIWGNSLVPRDLSAAMSGWVKDLLKGFFTGGGATEARDEVLVRKAAHFTEFSVLGVLLAWRCSMLGRKALWAFALGVGAACIDEGIQFLVPGRGPGLRDVALDSCGVLTGMILLYLGHTIYRGIVCKTTNGNNFGGK